jgi:hypothetical protein
MEASSHSHAYCALLGYCISQFGVANSFFSQDTMNPIIPALLLSMFTIQTGFSDFAIEKLRYDPDVRIEDAYKWLYQAMRGAEHAVTDEKMVREYLQHEWKTLGKPLLNELLWEPLRTDNELGRLNLRPFRARGGRMDDVANAFIESAREFKSDEIDFRAAWNALGLQLAHEPVGKLTWPEWRRLDEAMTAKKYPAIHHSANYNKARQPAYRVLTREAYEKLIKTVSGARPSAKALAKLRGSEPCPP